MAPIPPKKSKLRGQNPQKRQKGGSNQNSEAASTKVEMKRGQQLLMRQFEDGFRKKYETKIKNRRSDDEGAEQSQE